MQVPAAVLLSELHAFTNGALPLLCVVSLTLFLSMQSAAREETQAPFLGVGILLYLVVLHASRMWLLGVVYLGEVLWGCNVALALGGSGIALGKPLMVGTACCIVAVDQLCWYVDVLGYLATGKFPVGVAKYMVASTTTRIHVVTGTHHLWFLPVAIAWMAPWGGAPAGCYLSSVLSTAFIACAARLLTPYSIKDDHDKVKVWNINLAYEFYQDVAIPPLHIADHRHSLVYLPFLIIVCNFILNVFPVCTILALSRLPSRSVDDLIEVNDFTVWY